MATFYTPLLKQVPFFPYPGGKSKNPRLLDEILYHIVHLWTSRTEYREPFVGGGGVFLNFSHHLPDGARVWLNDKDSAIACLWMAVLQWPEELLERTQRLWSPSLDLLKLLNKALKWHVDPAGPKDKILDRAKVCLLVRHFNPHSGRKGGGVKTRGSSWEGVADRVRATHRILNRFKVRVTALDFLKVLTTRGKALYYLDPPYWGNGVKCYTHGFTKNQHLALEEALMACKMPWLLSYDDCPFIRRLYAGMTELLSLRQQSTMNKKTYGELLLTTPETYMKAEDAFMETISA